MNAQVLKKYLDELLEISKFDDISLNGLVIDTKRNIKKIGISVDTSLSAIEKAIKEDIDLILVHHGLYWGHPLHITGSLYKKIKLFTQNGIGLYVAHLPLDAHPIYGNNAQGIKLFNPDEVGQVLDIGFIGKFNAPKKRDDLLKVCKEKINPTTVLWDFGPQIVDKFVFISGDALSMLPKIIEIGVDTYITGEPKHSLYLTAKEEKINVFLTGHYKSETLGIKALGKHLKEKFKVNISFLDFPTGY